MTLGLFVLIAWVMIIIFFLIPKSLDWKENMIMFFSLSIIIISLSTVLDLNLKLIQTSKKVEMFVPVWLFRNIIIPLIFIVFLNLFNFSKNKLKKIGIAALTIAGVFLIEKVTLITGIIKHTGWNQYYTLLTIITLMTFSFFFAKLVNRIGKGAK